MSQTSDLPSYGIEGHRLPSMAPPYVSFNTLRTLLEWLKTEGVPLRFDHSFWEAKFSGSTGTQLMAALRFLGLLEGQRPLPDLERLVVAPVDDRRVILKELLRDSYAAVPFDQLDRATPAMVRSWFRSYPVDGHTLRKSISFFVNAAREAELPMSRAVTKMAKSRSRGLSAGGASERQTGRPAAIAANRDQRQRPWPNARQAGIVDRPTGETGQTVVDLESGGTATVSLDVDLFRLSDRDQEFVLELVGLIRSYQQGERGTADADGIKVEDAT